MKRCIWCNKTDSVTKFLKEAHTVPKSLGGKNICINVCDTCNEYFGNREKGMPSVEIILKEFLHLSQYILLLGINQPIRHKSEFFDINKKNLSIRLKLKYSLRKSYQDKLIRLFKRGIYKVFLEERERQRGDAHDDRFDFIREFARFDFNDYPVYYVKPFKGVTMFSTEDILNPAIRFTDTTDEIDADFRMYEYFFVGHRIAIPTSKFYTLMLDKFKKHVAENSPKIMGNQLIEINCIADVDFLFEHVKNG